MPTVLKPAQISFLYNDFGYVYNYVYDLPSFCRYLPVMKEFTGTASVRLAELEDLFVDMKARVSLWSFQAEFIATMPGFFIYVEKLWGFCLLKQCRSGWNALSFYYFQLINAFYWHIESFLTYYDFQKTLYFLGKMWRALKFLSSIHTSREFGSV